MAPRFQPPTGWSRAEAADTGVWSHLQLARAGPNLRQARVALAERLPGQLRQADQHEGRRRAGRVAAQHAVLDVVRCPTKEHGARTQMWLLSTQVAAHMLRCFNEARTSFKSESVGSSKQGHRSCMGLGQNPRPEGISSYASTLLAFSSAASAQRWAERTERARAPE